MATRPVRKTRRTVPAATLQRLRPIASRMKRQAAMAKPAGVAALFVGPAGTGKTMAAELLARELGLELYRVDLSRVVNKYLGETEKHLNRVFARAERSGAVLFFDEADALLGKRSEVKDSHDRYANMVVDYLLQRVDAYPGLAILATNSTTTIDAAFRRKLDYVVRISP